MIDPSNIVFTRCKGVLISEFGENGIFVGSAAAIPAQFPAATIRQLGAPATGSSFTSKQCACISTIEAQSFSSLTAEQAKQILTLTADTMDEMGYELIYGPEEITQEEGVSRYVARFRRVVGSGDEI